MYRWIRPKISVPVHGELRHLAEHARLARALQVPEAVVLANGQMLRLAPGKPEIVDEVPSGRVYLDGRVLVPEGDGIGRQRRAMAFAGLIVVTLILDAKGRVHAEPAILLEGIPDEVRGPVRAAVLETLRRHNPKKSDEQALCEAVRRSARKVAQSVWDKKPVTRVEVVWV
jgi:ribonuclease J